MDSLDGFQSERKEVDRKAEEEKKVKVGIIIKIFGLGLSFPILSNFWIERTELCILLQAAEHDRNTERLKELIRIKTEVRINNNV